VKEPRNKPDKAALPTKVIASDKVIVSDEGIVSDEVIATETVKEIIELSDASSGSEKDQKKKIKFANKKGKLSCISLSV
jgi:hypothetical protein